MPAYQPSANSLHANTLGEFAGTPHSQPLSFTKKNKTKQNNPKWHQGKSQVSKMTGIKNFKTFINQFPHYTDNAFELAEPFLKTNSIKKGKHILRQDSICRNIHFIVSGIFKVYYLRDGVEITTCFCKENRFTTSYQSLISGQPSELGIQAIEDSETVSIQYGDLKKLYARHLFWQQIGRMVTEQEYIITECYTRLINDKSAKQRYLEILNNEPDLFQRVSLIDLASYLQVTPETISRIRKQLAAS